MEKTSAVHNNRNIYLTVFIANLPFFAVGHAAGWSSPSIPIIISDDFFLKVTPDQASWMASLLLLGGFAGPFISGALLDIVGRKWTISVNMAVTLLGWIVMACARSVDMLYIGRFLCGITVAVTFTTVPLYIAEISEPNMRGFFNNLGLITRCMTILFEYSVGPFVSFFTLIMLSIIVPVLFFILVFWMPESPYFLIAKGKKEEAAKSLTWLRGEMPQNVLNKEISDIQAYLDKSTSQKGSYLDLFSKPNRRIVCITFGILIFNQLVGASIILFYLHSIFEATGSSLPSSFSAIIVGIAMTAVSFVVPVIAKAYGYRKPMIVSSAGTGICLVILGLCFSLSNRDIHSPVLNYIPVISLLSYMILLSIGMLNLPWAVAGEILPSNIKAQASAIAGSCMFLVGFLTCLTFPYITNLVGTDFGFWLYACLSFTSVFVIYFYVPETKGLTLNEIQDLIKLPPKNNDSQIDRDINSIEQCTISYLKNHYEINVGPTGTYKSITKNDKYFNV